MHVRRTELHIACLGLALALMPGCDDDAGSTTDASPPATDGASPDAAPNPDMARPLADSGVPGCETPVTADPFETPPGQWTWVLVDGMRCANGEPTGVGVNLAPAGSNRLVIYFEGGGACWDEASCYRQPSASNIAEGFDETAFGGGDDADNAFLRRSPDNAFGDHHQIYVPYCTGDLHAGDRVADYGGRETHHVGAPGVEALLARAAATLPDADRVILTGSSAGGYGAVFNWHRARAAFPCTRVDAIDDGGAILPQPEFPAERRDQWGTAWNFAETLPADCPDCATDWWRVVPYNLDARPDARAGLLTSMRDGVIASFMRVDGATFEAGVGRMSALLEHPRFATYLIPGEVHVLMDVPVVADGLSPAAWVARMQSDDPDWASVGPEGVEPPAEEEECDDVPPDCETCAFCAAETQCLGQLAACADDDCIGATLCAIDCDDAACVDQCVDGSFAEPARALYTCVRCDTCSAQCGACPD